MAQIYSKLPLPVTGTIATSCIEYVHPWTDSCLQAMSGLYLYAIFDSLRIYGTVYVVCTLTFVVLMVELHNHLVLGFLIAYHIIISAVVVVLRISF